MVPYASHGLTLTSKLSVYKLCWISMHGKVSLSTRLWYVDHSADWPKYIRFWDLDDFAGWRKATRSIPREISAKNDRPGLAWLCQQRGSDNKNSTYPTKLGNSEEMSPNLFRYLARLGREIPANQALWIAVDVRDGVVAIVVPEIPGCSELPLIR